LYDLLQKLISVLNRATVDGFITDSKIYEIIQFGTKKVGETIKTEENIIEENMDKLRQKSNDLQRDLDIFLEYKSKLFKDMKDLSTYICSQIYGKPLLKLTPENYHFYLKYLFSSINFEGSFNKSFNEQQFIQHPSQHSNPPKFASELKMDIWKEMINSNLHTIKTSIAENKQQNNQFTSSKEIQYHEVELNEGYKFMLDVCYTYNSKKNPEPNQIVFCNKNTQLSTIESNFKKNLYTELCTNQGNCLTFCLISQFLKNQFKKVVANYFWIYCTNRRI
jgi:hypothetical protein